MCRALTALPQFKGHLVPWCMEKLNQQEDTPDWLRLMAACVERFGAEVRDV